MNSQTGNEYPQTGRERDHWILGHRSSRNQVDPNRPYAFVNENERSSTGAIVSVSTIFLTNRECPWRCLMCDLWQNTLSETVPLGAIPEQIDYALDRLPSASHIKLYNSGSFFDPNAIPVDDYQAIAERVRSFENVIVECHPALVGSDCLEFSDMLRGLGTRMEVAMGLETVHPEILPKLNKRMTLELFADSAETLRSHDIDLRAFILLKPPFMDEAEAGYWAKQSIDYAFTCGASVAALIPTRAGNGGMEVLEVRGEFSPPKLSTLEAVAAYGIKKKSGRVFVDIWDALEWVECPHCLNARVSRLQDMNLRQVIPPPIQCVHCGADA